MYSLLEMVRRTSVVVAHESNLDENHGRYRFMNSSGTSPAALVVFNRLCLLIRRIYVYSYDFSRKIWKT